MRDVTRRCYGEDPFFSVAKCHSLSYSIQPIAVESGHTVKSGEVSERAVIGSIGNDCVRVFFGQSERDELLCIRRVDVDEAVSLREKRQSWFTVPVVHDRLAPPQLESRAPRSPRRRQLVPPRRCTAAPPSCR